jgi:hypothetical protein
VGIELLLFNFQPRKADSDPLFSPSKPPNGSLAAADRPDVATEPQ